MKAYAAKLDGQVLLNTVMPHPRGAMVNFLGTNTTMMPMHNWSDDQIKQAFQLIQQAMNVCIVELEVREGEVFDIEEQISF